LFIDMDRFKNVNDTFGHHVGDGLLLEVGRRLSTLVRESDIVARLGGDEFVLVLADTGHSAQRTAAALAGEIIATLSRVYLVEGHELHSTPSLGIGVFPQDGVDPDTLLKNADLAMYHAKAAGRHNFQFFTAAMNEATAERLALEGGLRTAIERNELSLHYQPQVDVASGRTVALEALLRWRHPQLGHVPPLKFIPVAEDTGQIEAIGAWVLDQALAQVARWHAAGHAPLRVAVNLSAQQLRTDGFVERVALGLQTHRLPGTALELEITESVAMRDPARTADMLLQLRGLGVSLAIDDFGTGHSSLAYLKQLPLNCLKLDRSFVMDLEHDANDAAICTATIQMAHSLGLGVVAEGVENPAQLAFLRRVHCDLVQGYHFSKPMVVADCDLYLQAQLPLVAAVLPG
jgi:diguanylate cyclase (GGDEF)-like protein